MREDGSLCPESNRNHPGTGRVLYLRVAEAKAPAGGIEPPWTRLTGGRSTIELHRKKRGAHGRPARFWNRLSENTRPREVCALRAAPGPRSGGEEARRRLGARFREQGSNLREQLQRLPSCRWTIPE